MPCCIYTAGVDATSFRIKIKTNVIHHFMSAGRPLVPSVICISVVPKMSASRGHWFIACVSFQERKKTQKTFAILQKQMRSGLTSAPPNIVHAPCPALYTWTATATGISTIVLRTSIILHNSVLLFLETERKHYLFKNKITT